MPSTRRLAAIMFTDLEGYTSLAHVDESGSLRVLEEQEKLIRPLLAAHSGKKIKSMGDGLLIEFPNALGAVKCAVQLQRTVHEHNAQEGARPLRMRVGIHVGDVERRGTDILGDAVNIASRIEPLAEPEGICLSFQVYDLVHNKLTDEFETIGPRHLKGVREAVEIYRVVFPWSRAAPRPEVPSLPRLAVLPLTNISPDPKDEYFADGLTEELISVLSQIEGIRVIARTSINQYRGTAKSVAQIGAELGVGSLLEGSVRISRDRLRVTLQLIDVSSQEHTWSNSFDRALTDVFDIQSDIAKHVAQVLRVTIPTRSLSHMASARTVDPQSFLHYLKGRRFLREVTVSALRDARSEFEKAISLDRLNAAAYTGLADAILADINWHTYPRAEGFRKSTALVTQALEIDPDLPESHATRGNLLTWGYDWQEAEREYRLAIALSPSCLSAHHRLSILLWWTGRTEQALREFAVTEEIDPLSAVILAHHTGLLADLGRLTEALALLARLKEVDPTGDLYDNVAFEIHCARGDAKGVRQSIENIEAREAHRPLDPATLEATERAIYRAIRGTLIGKKGAANRAIDLLKHLPPETAGAESLRAMMYASLGDLDECFWWLNLAVERHSLTDLNWVTAPRLERVRNDPRFERVLRKMNLPVTAAKT